MGTEIVHRFRQEHDMLGSGWRDKKCLRIRRLAVASTTFNTIIEHLYLPSVEITFYPVSFYQRKSSRYNYCGLVKFVTSHANTYTSGSK